MYTGHILSSRQSGGILDKILATTKWGAYQLIKASPAYLEETIKYADFIDTVDLEDIYHEAAIEILPNVTALQAIANSSIPQLPGASKTIVLPSSVSVYKCRRTSDGDVVIALSSAVSRSLDLDHTSNQGIVSAHGSRFFEKVESIVDAGPHTVVHTSLANCVQRRRPPFRYRVPPSVKLEVKTTGPSPVNKAPIVTGVGGTGIKGVLIFENVSPSGLDLSVGDVIVGRPSGPAAGILTYNYGSFFDRVNFLKLNPSSGVGTSCSENMGDDTPGAPRNSGNSGGNLKWCDTNETMFFHHEVLKTKVSLNLER